MNDAPRRRRRTQQPRRAQNSQFPFLPAAVAIVLGGGFAIGAFFSHHRQTHDTIAKISPVAKKDVASSQPSLATSQPTSEAAVASALPSVAPIASAKPVPSAQRVPPPDRMTVTSQPRHTTVGAASGVAPTVAATVPPPPSKVPTRTRPLPAPVPSGHPVTAPTLQTAQGGSGAAPVLSGGPDHVVRAYLTALIRGDERTANTALGRGPDSGNGFAEQDFIDAKARITSLHATARGDGGYTVETEVSGSKGMYFV
nr:hypothetical protein [Candidatus Eremiobacteraeota bacterium]